MTSCASSAATILEGFVKLFYNSDDDDFFHRDMCILLNRPLTSEDTSVLLESLHTEAAVLRQQLALGNPSAIPDASENKLLARIQSAVALIEDIRTKGSDGSGLPRRGLGFRAAAVRLARESAERAAAEMTGINPGTTASVTRPPGLPVNSLANLQAVKRPVTLPLIESSASPNAEAASSRPTSSSETSKSFPTDTSGDRTSSEFAPPPHSKCDEVQQLKLAKQQSLKSMSKRLFPRHQDGDTPQQQVKMPVGAGVGSMPRTPSSADSQSQAPSHISKRCSPELETKLKAARLKAEALQAAAELAQLEAEAAALDGSQHLGSSSSSTVSVQPNTFAAQREPQSPSPDEQVAASLRAQLLEIENRLAAEKAIATDPVANLQHQFAQLQTENAMLRRGLTAVPEHWVDSKNLSKESDKISLTGTLTPEGYRLWRNSNSVALVAAAGPNRSKAPGWFDEIELEASTPESLMSSCSPELQNLDSKYASALTPHIKGDPGLRINLALEGLPRLCRFSGRALQKLFDIEYGFLSKESRANLVAKLYKLAPDSNDYPGLDAFLRELESIILQLGNTKEAPSQLLIRTLLEDKVEARMPMKTVSAEFANFRSTDVEDPTSLIEALKATCRRERLRVNRTKITGAAAVERTQTEPKLRKEQQKLKRDQAASAAATVKVAAANTAKPDVSKQPCYKFQRGECSAGKNCPRSHDTAFNKAHPAPKDKNKPKSEDNPSRPSGGMKIDAPCRFFQRGHCMKGDDCRFNHVAKTTACIIAAPVIPRAVIPIPNLPNVLCCGVLDSGSGMHVESQAKGRETFKVSRIDLDTVGGIVPNDTAVKARLPLPDKDSIELESRLVEGSPTVYSLGRLCMLAGFGFYWRPKTLPILQAPSGSFYEVPLEHFVPVLKDVEAMSQSEAFEFVNGLCSSLPCLAAPQLPSVKILLEFCCDADSSFGQISKSEFGVETIRISLQEADVSTEAGIKHVLDLLEHLPKDAWVCGWASLPCSPWSPLHNV